MNKREFHNALRILRCIDRWDVEWMTDDQWASFRDHPYEFTIRCSDADYDRLWLVIEAPSGREKSGTMTGKPTPTPKRQVWDNPQLIGLSAGVYTAPELAP